MADLKFRKAWSWPGPRRWLCTGLHSCCTALHCDAKLAPSSGTSSSAWLLPRPRDYHLLTVHSLVLSTVPWCTICHTVLYPTAIILRVCQHGAILSCICATVLYVLYCNDQVCLSTWSHTELYLCNTVLYVPYCDDQVCLSTWSHTKLYLCHTVLYVPYCDDQMCLSTWSCIELYLWTLRWRTRPATYPEFGNVQLYMVVVQAWVAVVLLVKAVNSTQQDVEDNVIPLLALQVHV